MLMLNDPEDTVLGDIYTNRGNYPKLYETTLMQGGGHLKGWFIDDEAVLSSLIDSLYDLKQKSIDDMLFAVGDGNHTLASAKQVWENHKFEIPEEERKDHPLRYALVEVINLYDKGLSMQPIHRVLFGVETPNFLRALVEELNNLGLGAKMMYTRGLNNANAGNGSQNIYFESKQAKGRIEIENPQHKITAIALTQAIDNLLNERPKVSIDYIHGDEEFESLTKEHGCLGFRMEAMTKNQLFDLVEEYGVLPRKAFSLGEAQEKRYYYECRLLVKEQEEAQNEEEIAAASEPKEPEPENQEQKPKKRKLFKRRTKS